MRSRTTTALVLLAAAAIASCGGGDEPTSNGAEGGGAADGATTEDERPLSDAVDLYVGGTSPTCQVCHGEKGEGAMMGPALDGLAEDWDVDALAAFLLDPPAALAESERLTELAGRYSMPMPEPSGFTESDARVMARWLLEGLPR